MAAQLSAWGQAKLPPVVYAALASTAEGVMALEQMMRGQEPGLARESAPPTAESETELRAMMRDPRYWRSRDPEFVICSSAMTPSAVVDSASSTGFGRLALPHAESCAATLR